MSLSKLLVTSIILALLSFIAFSRPSSKVELPRSPIRVEPIHNIIQTDSARFFFNLDTTYFNHTDGALYISSCFKNTPVFSLEKRVGRLWQLAFETPCLAVSNPPIKVESKGEHTSQLFVEAIKDSDAAPRFEVKSIPGTYRLVFYVYRNADSFGVSNQLDKEQISNSFELKLP